MTCAPLTFLGLVGFTILVVRGSLFERVRRWGPLRCAQCFGTWVGAGAGVSGVMRTGQGLIFDIVLVGAAIGLAATLADAVLSNLLGDPNEGKRP